MISFRIRHLVLAIISAAILPSCVGEKFTPDVPVEPEERITSVIHYKATVGESPLTKASLNNLNQYIFETGDQLYVVSGDDLYGILNLVAGAGDPIGTFEGDLMCLNDFEPNDGTTLSATLVSRQDKIHNFSDGKITSTDYDSADPVYASSFPDAIRYYSDFTAESTYGAHTFSLEQNTVFLCVSVTFNEEEDAIINGAANIIATIKNGDDVLRTGAVPVETIDFSSQANFIAAFPPTTISNASIIFTTSGGAAISTDADIATSGSVNLIANRYYEISRSHVDLDYFTVQAREDGTTITFNYSGEVEYRKNSGSWTEYSSAISLDEKDYVQFRSKRSLYNTDGTPIIAADKPVFIYGDIMSLICDASFNKKTNLNSKAFQFAFKNADYIDIPAGRPLRLTASTLGTYCYNQMFQGCTSLTRAPELQTALTANVPTYAYAFMFQNCTSLTSAPELPSGVSVGANGYQGMFKGCTSLTTVPATIDGTRGNTVCREMFMNCVSLANAPSLPSTSVGSQGYYSMFQGCTSLVQAPNLPAETISSECYRQMFQGCTALVLGPSELPATTLASSCYRDMFIGCLSLSRVPSILPATSSTDAASCYRSMFNGCISLNQGPEIKLESIGIESCYQMFKGCTSLTSVTGLENIESVANSGCYEMFLSCAELTTTPSVLKATSVGSSAYYNMYSGCAKITSAPDIKATSVSTSSFNRMFYGCRRLRTPPPTLAIATVSEKAFKEMFSGCTALVSAPDLSAMEEVGLEGCMSMFYGCSNLRSAPELPATTLSESAYYGMFQNSGLTSAPSLPAMTLANKCYKYMFGGCLSLEGPITLPAPELKTECYNNMFNGASLLNSVVCLATDHSATDCTKDWLKNVSATGTFVRPSGIIWATESTSGIPTGWTPQDTGIDPIFPGGGSFNPEEDL
ncbi:MAG: leucine-rich repeat protein [Bacteroidales bacterium]|nr:leucine-rich repeat protein [Bacteroidales bacterium]